MRRWIDERRGTEGRPSGAEAHPAATVVLARDTEAGIEVLMLRRSSKLAFHGGAWVFPGGRIDPEDWEGAGDDVLTAAKRAAAREAMEEAGVTVDPATLVHFSNWTTPEIAPKRFATWFFVAPAGEGHADAVADGTEAEEHRWFRPADALAARAAGEIELAPPQFVTLLALHDHGTVAAVLTAAADADPVDFAPRFHFLEGGGAVCVYAEDVAFDDAARLEADGPRHRLLMTDAAWTYERSPSNP